MSFFGGSEEIFHMEDSEYLLRIWFPQKQEHQRILSKMGPMEETPSGPLSADLQAPKVLNDRLNWKTRKDLLICY